MIIHVRCVDGGGIRDGVDGCESCRTFRRRAWQAVGNPTQSDDVAGVNSRDHEHHCHIPWRSAGRCRRDDKRRDAHVERKGDVKVSFSGPIGVPRVTEGGDNAQDLDGGQ